MKFLSDTKASVILLAVMAIILGAATLVEHFAGVSWALAIYHNPVTIVLWILLVANWLLIWKKLLDSKKIPIGSTLLHLSFAVMLSGAFITMTTEVEGRMDLDPGQTKGMIIKDNGRPAGLPFTIALDSLEVKRYPGTGNPSGFTSFVTVTREGEAQKMQVSVNHPLRIDGWRIYQASYTPETGGSVFSISHDPIGTAVSFTGYALLLLAFLLLMFSPNSRFSHLRKTLSALGCCTLLLFASSTETRAAQYWDNDFTQDSKGRIVTVDTYCRELMRKIHHSETWEGKDAVEAIESMVFNPASVFDAPFIYQKNKELAAIIGQGEGKYVSFRSLLGPGDTYKIEAIVNEALTVPAQQRSKLQKDALKLDEKANLLYSLVTGREHPALPEGSVLPTPAQARQELLCNRLKPFKTGAMGYMLCALLLMVCSLLLGKGVRAQKVSCGIVLCLTAMVFLLHTWGIAARWFCSGQPPLSNSYEVTVFLSWCIALLSLLLSRRSTAASAFGILFAGTLLLVAGMNNMDPVITPLVPVLQSPWLMFHVAVIIAGYACFGINFLLSVYTLGAMALNRENKTAARKAAVLVEMFALVGLMLMTLGTFLGAVWAGESWGSYWSWDPKETWALVTVLVYSVCTHSRLVPRLNNPKWLCILSIIGFACVLMTYFGVNYFLVGMHSYAR